MNTTRTRIAAVALMGIAAAGLSTSTAVADARAEHPPTAREGVIGGLPNMHGYCRAAGWDQSKPLDPGDAYSWVCVIDATGEVGLIDMDDACRWHHPAYPGAVGRPLDAFNAFSWRCYA